MLNDDNFNEDEFDVICLIMEDINELVQNVDFDLMYSEPNSTYESPETDKLFFIVFNHLCYRVGYHLTTDNVAMKKTIVSGQRIINYSIGNKYLVIFTDGECDLNYEPKIKIRLTQYPYENYKKVDIVWTNYVGSTRHIKK